MSALPPVVVSGLPNMTPIFMRIWLMKITMAFERLMLPVSLRSACDIQAGLQTDVRIAHFAFDLGFRGQRGNRVDDNDVHSPGAHQHVRDLQCLLTRIGLRHQQFVDVDTQFLRVLRVERMFGVDKRGGTAGFLRFGNDLQGERRLAGGLGTVDFDNPSFRQTADAERHVETNGSGRYLLDVAGGAAVAEPHDGPLAELFFDLAECLRERFFAVVVHYFAVIPFTVNLTSILPQNPRQTSLCESPKRGGT